MFAGGQFSKQIVTVYCTLTFLYANLYGDEDLDICNEKLFMSVRVKELEM